MYTYISLYIHIVTFWPLCMSKAYTCNTDLKPTYILYAHVYIFIYTYSHILASVHAIWMSKAYIYNTDSKPTYII